MGLRRSSIPPIMVALLALALLAGVLASSAKAIGVYKYGLTGGILYSSQTWQAGGTSDLYNGSPNNIGSAYVEIHRNGVGLVSTNYPGEFLVPYDAAIVCIAANCNPGYSVIGKCKSSNTRTDASCAIG